MGRALSRCHGRAAGHIVALPILTRQNKKISPSDSATDAPARAAILLVSTALGAVYSEVRCSHPLSYRPAPGCGAWL